VDQYLLVIESAKEERKLSGTVHYNQERRNYNAVLMTMIKESAAQEAQQALLLLLPRWTSVVQRMTLTMMDMT